LLSESGTPTFAAPNATQTTIASPHDGGTSWGPWSGWTRSGAGTAGGRVSSVTPTTVTVTAPDGSTTALATDSSTIFDRVTNTSAPAITAGKVALVYGDEQGPAMLRASVVVVWAATSGSSTTADASSGWGAWARVQGTVQSVASSSFEVTTTDGTSTTIDYGQ